MLSALIVDDEDKVRETIKHMLSVYCPNINVVGEANSVQSGYNGIIELKPDVVFLDIKMPDGTGFELLKKFEKIDFYFIVITAFEEFAIQSFKVSALDYLLKPIDATDLMNAVVKLTKVIDSDETKIRLNTLISNIESGKNESKKIVIKTLDGVFVVQSDEIVRCESDNNYTVIHFKDTTKILVSKTLKEFDDILTPLSFVRCHQSHLINTKYIVKYIKFPNAVLLLTDDTSIPISVRKKEAIERLVKSKLA